MQFPVMAMENSLKLLHNPLLLFVIISSITSFFIFFYYKNYLDVIICRLLLT